MNQVKVFSASLFLIGLIILVELLGLLDSLNYFWNEGLSGSLLNTLILLILLVVMASATLKSDESFRYWWRFARFAIPISLVVIVPVNFGVLRDDSASYIGDIDALFEFVALGLVHGIFSLGSLIQIFRGYRAGKRAGTTLRV